MYFIIIDANLLTKSDIWGTIDRNPNTTTFQDNMTRSFITPNENNETSSLFNPSMQFKTSKINRMIKRNNTSVNELQMKFSGIDPSLEKSFSSKKGLFLKDNMEVETEEEKMLKKIVVDEGDALRNLALLPADSEVYMMKLREMQPLINYRIELEKIVQEQRFSRMREDYHPYSTVNIFFISLVKN